MTPTAQLVTERGQPTLEALLEMLDVAEGTDRVTIDLTGERAEVRIEPAAPIFENAARFRPLVMSVTVSIAMLVLLALSAFAPLLLNQPTTRVEPLLEPAQTSALS